MTDTNHNPDMNNSNDFYAGSDVNETYDANETNANNDADVPDLEVMIEPQESACGDTIAGDLDEVLYLDTSEVTDKTDTTDSPRGAVEAEDAATSEGDLGESTAATAQDVPEAIAMEMPNRAEDGRPIIRVQPGRLQEIMREAEQYLAGTGAHFQRGGVVVTVYRDPATGESVVKAMQPMSVVHALDGVSVWMKQSKGGNGWVQVDPPLSYGSWLARGAGGLHYLPVLNGLARQPFLRPDGTVCTSPGYDAATGFYGVFDAGACGVPAVPSPEQAQQALAVLEDLLREFAFVSPSDRSAALSAMLTAAVRTSLPRAPMYHVRAPQIASGKSYLCDLITAFATPQKGTPVGFPVRDEECTKLLLAQLGRSPAVIAFDNLTGDLIPFKSLCMALTNERMEGRVLGSSKVMTVSTRTLLLSSGNNVGPVADMTRRVVTINLDPRCETPATRAFARPHLISEVRRDRERYVAAALTIVRAWIVAGKPNAACPALASFEDWSAWCRQPLLWLGQPDPAEAVFVGLAEDPDREVLGRLLLCWHGIFGNRPLRVKDVASWADSGNPTAADLLEVLHEFCESHGRLNHRKLGQRISRHAGRVVDGLRLTKAPKTRNVENWRVESVESVVSVVGAPQIELLPQG